MVSNASASGIPKKVRLEFAVNADNSSMRLDRFLRTQLKLLEKSVPQQVVCKWIREGKITMAKDDSVPQLTKKDIQPTTRVQTGQRWLVTYVEHPSKSSSSVQATDVSHESKSSSRRKEGLPLDQWIMYEDEDIVVLNKPTGVAVQGGTTVDRSIDSSLEVLQRPGYPRPRLVHRIDQTTSGLLIIGKSRTATERLGKLFQQAGDGSGYIKKAYIAVVQSEKPLDYQFQGTKQGLRQLHLEGHMAKINTGRHQSIKMLADDHAREAALMAKGSEHRSSIERVWHCSTDVELIKSNAVSAKISGTEQVCWRSVLRLWPHTGRKHQLRIQCAYQLQAPMVGDKKYNSHWYQDSDVRLCLHLERIELKTTAKRVSWFL
ncbi:hypothetical protein DFQ27_008808 [Actinomortierella ambigua]|uniref:21S rRNA pseudouridine(2819) synthase n=1 Tax=Actinomortierella ambigua TaxID=1343610 RepID=A0A9P6QHN0_9FUNG|nr:hypothetical protein DFQ27_008808 [Actinomortierella ambigua]